MLSGVLFGIAACMIWGCVYVAPLILPDYSPVHIAMMRYLVFGMLAAGLAVPEWRELKFYSTADWRRALALGIVGNIFYYWLLGQLLAWRWLCVLFLIGLDLVSAQQR